MNHWLVKSDPDTYSFEDLKKDGSTSWDGVRNFAARLHLKGMKKGDLVLVYHSQEEKSVTGIAKVTKEFYPDPTADDPNWVSVELKYQSHFKKPVTLGEIKADKRLKNMLLIRIGRLSVMPVKPDEYEAIVKMGG